jgi:hypothetical protein
MRTVALPGYREVDGNRGAWVMHRIEGDIAHFDMLSFLTTTSSSRRNLMFAIGTCMRTRRRTAFTS